MTASSESLPVLHSAERLRGIGVSEIMQVTLAANALKAQGRKIILLGVGEPDFDTPEHVKAAAARAMRNGDTKYTPVDGTSQIKQAIREKFRRENLLEFALDQITVANGAKQIIFNAMMATLDPNDEVIIPAPFWPSYVDIARFAGAKPIFIPCPQADSFRLTAEKLEAAITPRTRWLILNSPCNPSGSAYSIAQLRPVLDVLLRHPDVWILADDIYEHIVYDGLRLFTPAALEPALQSRTLTVNGVSKTYAMTGWRIGFAGGPKRLIQAMAAVQSQSAICPSSISQAAAAEALTGPQDIVRERRKEFQLRRDFIVEALNSVPGLACRKPEGAFFVLANWDALMGRRTRDGKVLTTDAEFTNFLLHEAEVAVIPGSAFGLSPFVRISYAAAMDALEEASRRIARACAALLD
jgi:aspartate aminotransferase